MGGRPRGPEGQPSALAWSRGARLHTQSVSEGTTISHCKEIISFLKRLLPFVHLPHVIWGKVLTFLLINILYTFPY